MIGWLMLCLALVVAIMALTGSWQRLLRPGGSTATAATSTPSNPTVQAPPSGSQTTA